MAGGSPSLCWATVAAPVEDDHDVEDVYVRGERRAALADEGGVEVGRAVGPPEPVEVVPGEHFERVGPVRRQAAVVRLAVGVEGLERQVEGAGHVRGGAPLHSEVRRVRRRDGGEGALVGARQPAVVAVEAAVGVAGVNEVVARETLVEAELQRVVVALRLRRRRDARQERATGEPLAGVGDEEGLVARGVGDAHVLDGAVDLLVRVARPEHDVAPEPVLGADRVLGLPHGLRVGVDEVRQAFD